MKSLNKDYVLATLSKEKLWNVGEKDTFIFENWNITLRKEEEIYKPFMYSLNGEKLNSNEKWCRRYTSMDKAFLHIFNHFNENTNIKNKYETLEEVLKAI